VKALDRILQRWRIAKAAPHIRLGARVLDVGCADGELFRLLRKRIAGGVGIDPAVAAERADGAVRLIRGRFPEDLRTDERFDAITMLALFEHLSDEDQRRAIDACAHLLAPQGRVVLTGPEPVVDRIVHLLSRVGLLAGMAMHEHHGFVARLTPPLFERAGFALERHERFQLRMNNLFVFSRRSEQRSSPSTDG
jgi:2-polyprenyl-3-methyl-5-hydroxy-6-metoxy-1,4-benzoquinol methylase